MYPHRFKAEISDYEVGNDFSKIEWETLEILPWISFFRSFCFASTIWVRPQHGPEKCTVMIGLIPDIIGFSDPSAR
jgi:hypothetical protein